MIKPELDWEEVFDDPIMFTKLCWPQITLYDKQVEILKSVKENDETFVPAGNELGKDFVAGLCALWFFCSRTPCRVVTSSSGQTQLKSVLWGEIRRFIAASQYPLPIMVKEMLIRQYINNAMEPRSYLVGIVTIAPENMQGHHLARDGKPRTLAIFDEASGIDSIYYNASDTWAHRKLVIGNPLPCTNFFFEGVEAGDLPSHDGKYYRKVIRITAEDSPNVRLAKAQEKEGKEPTNEELIPGVVDLPTYRKRRQLWDKIRQCIGLDAQFYKGSEVLFFPEDWLDRAEEIALAIGAESRKFHIRTMGVDSAEGGDYTVWTVIDELGILFQHSVKTADTSDVPGTTLGFMREWDVKPENVAFDRGGGGKQHADQLRAMGFNVRTVGFGESPTDPMSHRKFRVIKGSEERLEESETRYVYRNRRAEMYGMARSLFNPEINEAGFGMPEHYKDLRKQLAPLPLRYDGEGRLFLPPKNKRNPNSREPCLRDIIGRSPDEADSFVLAVFALLTKPAVRVLTAF